MSEEILIQCPVCGLSEQRALSYDYKVKVEITCKRCGLLNVSMALVKEAMLVTYHIYNAPA